MASKLSSNLPSCGTQMSHASPSSPAVWSMASIVGTPGRFLRISPYVPQVNRWLCAVRFIEHVLNVLIEPAHLLQVRVERRQERVEMRFGARIVGAQIFAPNFAIFDNERRNPEW